MNAKHYSLAICFLAISLSSLGCGQLLRPQATWQEITSATDIRDFKTNCEYYLVFKWNNESPRVLFLNFIAISDTGYPGVSSVIATDFSRGSICRVDNTDKQTAKCDGINYPARIFECCYSELP